MDREEDRSMMEVIANSVHRLENVFDGLSLEGSLDDDLVESPFTTTALRVPPRSDNVITSIQRYVHNRKEDHAE